MVIIRKNIVLFIMMLVLSVQVFASDMQRKEIQSLRLSIEIPQSLSPTPDKLAKIKYPSKNKPQVIYSNERGTISLGISRQQKTQFIQPDDINEVKDSMLKNLEHLSPQAIPVVVDGNKAWLIIFESQAIDSKILNIQLVTITSDSFIIATFNMTEDNIQKFQPIGKRSLMSIRFNENKEITHDN